MGIYSKGIIKYWKSILIILAGGALGGIYFIGNNPPPEFVTAPENNTFKIGVKNFQEEFKENITDDKPLQYKLDDKFISFKPVSISIDNNQILKVKNVKKHIDKVSYQSVFGEGIDLEVNSSERIWSKVIKINSLKELGTIPVNAQNLEIIFEVETNFVIDGWNKKDDFLVDRKIRIGDYSYLERPKAWDNTPKEIIDESDEKTEKKTIRDEILLNGYFFKELNKLYFKKEIPISWLKTADFPIYTDVDITYGTASAFETGAALALGAFKLNTNKFGICWVENTETILKEGICKVGSVSGNTITWGSSSQYVTDVFGPYNHACAVATDKIAVVYADDGLGDNGYIRIATTSDNTTIGNWGTAFEFNTRDTENMACAGVNTDKVAIAYNDETGGDDLEILACAISGVSVTDCGSPAIDNSGFPKYTEAKKLASDKGIFAWKDNNNYLEIVACTFSGTNITCPTDTDIEINANNHSPRIAVLADDQFIVAYGDYDTAYRGAAKVGTTTGTAIALGNEDYFTFSNPTSTLAIQIDATHALLGFGDTEDGSKGKTTYTTVNFNNLTFSTSTPDTFETSSLYPKIADYEIIEGDLISTNKVVICYVLNSTNDGYCIIGDYQAAPLEPKTKQEIWWE